MPHAMCAGSSAVWLNTVYVAAIRTDASATSATASASARRSRKAPNFSENGRAVADVGCCFDLVATVHF